jgi:hypothetical protein
MTVNLDDLTVKQTRVMGRIPATGAKISVDGLHDVAQHLGWPFNYQGLLIILNELRDQGLIKWAGKWVYRADPAP